MEFGWDNKKNEANIAKHGLDFTDAQHIFEDETLTFKDERFDYGEERFITVGTLVGRLVIVVHTYREHVVRIISMRKANEREKKYYLDRLEKT